MPSLLAARLERRLRPWPVVLWKGGCRTGKGGARGLGGGLCMGCVVWCWGVARGCVRGNQQLYTLHIGLRR